MSPGSLDGRPLPKFTNPPVAEMVVGLEFLPAQTLNTVELVKTHEIWSTDYPKIREQVPLAPTTQPQGLVAGFGLQIGGMPNIRLWMLASDERQLLQLQNDRLVLNWRRLGATHYPSFDRLFPEFTTRWAQLEERMKSLEQLQPLVAEVAYVNQIQAPGESTTDLSRVASNISTYPGPGKKPVTRAQFIAEIEDAPGQTVVTFEPDEASATLALTVSTRISVSADPATGTDAYVRAFHLAHAASVVAFADVTTAEMHKIWGRTA